MKKCKLEDEKKELVKGIERILEERSELDRDLYYGIDGLKELYDVNDWKGLKYDLEKLMGVVNEIEEIEKLLDEIK